MTKFLPCMLRLLCNRRNWLELDDCLLTVSLLPWRSNSRIHRIGEFESSATKDGLNWIESKSTLTSLAWLEFSLFFNSLPPSYADSCLAVARGVKTKQENKETRGPTLHRSGMWTKQSLQLKQIDDASAKLRSVHCLRALILPYFRRLFLTRLETFHAAELHFVLLLPLGEQPWIGTSNEESSLANLAWFDWLVTQISWLIYCLATPSSPPICTLSHTNNSYKLPCD